MSGTKAAPRQPDDVLTTQDVVLQYKVSTSTIYRLRTKGVLKPYDVSGLVTRPHEYKYLRSDIEDAIAAKKAAREGRKPKA